MLNPLSILVSGALLAAAGAALGETQPQIERQSCDLMSREEMQLCSSTKPGDVSGARSVRCDQLSRATIEACLKQPRSEATTNPSSAVASAPNDKASDERERR